MIPIKYKVFILPSFGTLWRALAKKMALCHCIWQAILSITHSYCSSVSVTCRHEILLNGAEARVCYNRTYRIRTIEILQLKLMTHIYLKYRRYSVCQEHATPSNIKILASASFAALWVMFKYWTVKAVSLTTHSFGRIFFRTLSVSIWKSKVSYFANKAVYWSVSDSSLSYGIRDQK